MKAICGFWLIVSVCLCQRAAAAEAKVLVAGERRRNNLVSELLEVSSIAGPGTSFSFTRPGDGWIFISARCAGHGTIAVTLDAAANAGAVIDVRAAGGNPAEAVRFVKQGEHRIRVACDGTARVERLVVKAIPELVHCGLGFDPAIKAFGHYDMAFLKRDVLPNVTTLIVPHNIQLPRAAIDDWHRRGKRFIAEVGIDGQAKTADEHVAYWRRLLDAAPFLDGILINEFIINRPSPPRSAPNAPPRKTTAASPRRGGRMREQERYRLYEKAIRQLRADGGYRDKAFDFYFGGSGNTLNQEIIGPTLIHTIRDCQDRIALERYIFERSSEQRSGDALNAFVDGIADWNRKEPGVNRNMIIAFGLFSMPPGGINKLPNVDYHVWMDQQMNVLANHPVMARMAGVEWWTSLLADEETVRFVGKLYRHYGIEGRTDMLTRDPLFLAHLENADFEKGTAGWELHPAETGSIQAKRFPRYGRIEMRFMGQSRPADPEHIGDTFLWMKRSAKGPNTFSQTIKNLQLGRLYSLEMLTCDEQDLLHPKTKKREEANPFVGSMTIEGVEVDPKRSFTEMYPSSPEPPIPVWITYHWTVFRAIAPTAKLTVSDWPAAQQPGGPYGQEQTYNFLELQPYHE